MDFKEFLDLAGYSANTKQQYGYYEKHMPTKPTQADINALVMKHNNNVFRAFLKLYLEDFLKINGIEIPRIRGHMRQKRIKFLTGREIAALYRGAKLRLRIIILLGFESGLRIGEMLGIKPTDIDFVTGELRILGKGNKEDIVPLSPRAQKLLKIYIKRRKIGQNEKVFPTYRQKVNHLLKKLGNRTINKHVSSHMLRHSCGVYLRRRGMDLKQIQSFLRHSKLETTGIYTTATKDEVRKVWSGIIK